MNTQAGPSDDSNLKKVERNQVSRIWTEKGRRCANEETWHPLCYCHHPERCARLVFERGERSVDCDEDGWPIMTEERRQLWYSELSKGTSDESLVKLMLKGVSEGRHDKAPWAFKVDGSVYEDYEYIATLAYHRGWLTGTYITRVEGGAS